MTNTAIRSSAKNLSLPRGDAIRIRGARTHNLQNIDLDIPQHQLVVLTGLSGSGKSSLAFDTLLAEGQRQYLESLSVSERQFFDQLQRPDVDCIEGLQPTIAIDQHPARQNPRSTVATITEIYDFLRVLMARTAEIACPDCQIPISQQTPAEIQTAIAQLPVDTKVMLLAPMVRGRTGQHAEIMERIRQEGFVRVRIDGATYDVEQAPPLQATVRHQIEAVVDRLVIREGIENRLAESVRLALKHGAGSLRISFRVPEAASSWQERVYSTLYACPACHRNLEEIEPRTFSFNSPYGACPGCDGLGTRAEEDSKTQTACPACQGARLRPEARSCRLGGLAIQQITALSLTEVNDFFTSLTWSPAQQPVAEPLLAEILKRLRFLLHNGLAYLALNRTADTLSGGELQRVRLATGLGSGLVGVLYILDEPSIGLHPRDNDQLIASLRDLQQQGNTVLVVEHDQDLMQAADWLVDMGPGAGDQGGTVITAGPPRQVAQHPHSLTGGYLAGRRTIPVPQHRRRVTKASSLRLTGAELHNLQQVDVDVPLGTLTCVTGVSGSGKSSLVIDTLARAVAGKLQGATAPPGPYRELAGSDKLERLIHVDQAPIGRTPRSNPATYTGLFDGIRQLFASTKAAKQLGYKRGRFSFNAAGGRCDTCQGHGVQRIDMRFLPDLFLPCPSCQGRQFNRQTLAVRFRDQSIADVLAMSIDEAVAFFANHPFLHGMLSCLVEVGLGYVSLGQSATTLSGGEAQRIKLAAELGRPTAGNTLYILDEPTTGLHPEDIARLLGVLQKLVERGQTVLVIEHNLDVIKTADWVIDLGPEGGAGGGHIVAAGTPEDIAQCPDSYTGRWLKKVLESGD